MMRGAVLTDVGLAQAQCGRRQLSRGRVEMPKGFRQRCLSEQSPRSTRA